MRVLIVIAHVFAPREGSMYSSMNESKRDMKSRAIKEATIGNLERFSMLGYIHASTGKGGKIVTRRIKPKNGVELHIKVLTNREDNLCQDIQGECAGQLEIVYSREKDYKKIPGEASRMALESYADFDMVCYMEDDISIEDRLFFHKIRWLVSFAGDNYAFVPHRCERIRSRGDVVLSGDPDGGREDLFWATNEQIEIGWPTGNVKFIRAVNPHSGCYFLTKRQAGQVVEYWERLNWQSRFMLSGPLEQAASGMIIPVLKVMKTLPEHYSFLMVKHNDELWKRHWVQEE